MDRHGIIQNIYYYIIIFYQVLPSDLFGCFKWPFQGLSDLHLGDQKVTWKKLVHRSATAPFLKTFQESQSRWSMHWRWSPGFPNQSVSISTGEFSSSHAFLVLFDEMIEMIKLLEYGRGSPVLTCWFLSWLVVSTHLKNISQIGNLPQIGVKIKNIWNHHLVSHFFLFKISQSSRSQSHFSHFGPWD